LDAVEDFVDDQGFRHEARLAKAASLDNGECGVLARCAQSFS
jgi:hypothetical protein